MKLAVIMPNYNKGEFIPDAIKSIHNQSYKAEGFYIFDDGSTDNSVEIAKSLGVSVFERAENKGVSYTLNRAVEYLNENEYTHFYIMASDDTIEPTLLEKLVAMIDKEHSFYTCHARMYGTVNKVFYSAKELSLKLFRKSSPLLTTGIYSIKMWNELGGRLEDWKLTHDYEFFLRMFIKGYKHRILDEILYNWRNYEGQLSRTVKDDRHLRQKAFEINGLKW